MEINFVNGNVKDFREMLNVFEEVFEWKEKSKVDDNYISNILTKLNCKNRTEAVKKATEKGWI